MSSGELGNDPNVDLEIEDREVVKAGGVLVVMSVACFFVGSVANVGYGGFEVLGSVFAVLSFICLTYPGNKERWSR